MKILKVTLIIVFLFTGGYILIANKNINTSKDNLSVEVSKIIINNIKIDSLLNIVITDNQNYLNNNDCFLLMDYFHGDNDTNYVRITPYEKEKFIITCSTKDNHSIFGYFEVESQTILLLGNTFFDEIRFLNEKEVFKFRCAKKHKKGSVPPPPSMYNPPVYTFLYEKEQQ